MVNRQRLLWASFFSIFAAGVGFAIRGGILGDWAKEYGFTNTDLGNITGGGLTGFGVIIIIFSFVADQIGYGKLMIFAFLMHILSAILTLCAGLAFKSGGKDACYQCLYLGHVCSSGDRQWNVRSGGESRWWQPSSRSRRPTI